MKTVFITGATSFIGFALCRKMIEAGYIVHVVTRPSTDMSRFDSLENPPAFHLDEGDGDSLQKALAGSRPDVVFHMATKYLRDHTAADIAPMIESNVVFGTRLLEAMTEVGTSRLVYAGTYAQHYGEDVSQALNLNAATKEAFRTIVGYYCDAKGVVASQLTLFDVYGPGDWRFRLVDAIRKSQRTNIPLPLPSEDLPLDLVFVDDVVSAFVQAGLQICKSPDSINGREFAVSSGQRFLLSEIIDVFEEIDGRKVVREWGKFPIPERAPRSLWTGAPVMGWRPKILLREGVRRLIKEEDAD